MNGGEAVPLNLLCMCEGHHLAVHAGSLVIEGDAISSAALRARGVAKELVRRAVEATPTWVDKI